MEKDKGKNTGHIGYLWEGEVGERADMNEREVSEIKDVEPCKYFLFKTQECFIYIYLKSKRGAAPSRKQFSWKIPVLNTRRSGLVFPPSLKVTGLVTEVFSFYR